MKRLWWTVLLCLAVAATTANASEQVVKIEQQLDGCMARSEGVTVVMRNCFADGTQQMDKRLNEVYRQLVQTLPPAKQTQLKNAQRKWLAFREAEQSLSFSLDPNDGGTAQLVNADALGYNFLKQRVGDLEQYLTGLSE